jgi:hypothetical protein
VAATKLGGFGWPRAVSRQLSAVSIGTFFRLFRRLRCEKVALRATLIHAQSAKKRDQRSAVSHQRTLSNQAAAWNIPWNIDNLSSMFLA